MSPMLGAVQSAQAAFLTILTSRHLYGQLVSPLSGTG